MRADRDGGRTAGIVVDRPGRPNAHDEVTLSELQPPLRTGRRVVGPPRRRSRIGLGVFLGVMVLSMMGLSNEDAPAVPAELSAGAPSAPVAGLTAIADWVVVHSSSPAASASAASTEPEVDVLSASVSEDHLPRVFARVDGLDLRMPAMEPVAAGFHEASTANAIEMLPVGRAVANLNTTRFQPPPTDPLGTEYVVMASRGRAFPATSALDVAMRAGEAVLAPVTGTVSDVRTYWLYGKHEDHRVEIVPDDASHLRVVLVHVEGVRVAAGERVEVGATVLAEQANRFPFTSQIDRETEPELLGHVHLEVQPVDAPRIGD